jgi:hypothetical protein
MSEILFESELTEANKDISGPYEDINKTRVCRICLEEKNIQDFEMTTRSVKKVYRKNMCRPCNKNERLGEKSLKKVYGSKRPIGTPCDNCGKTTSNLSLDHCHKTNEFRGWLCQVCNNAIGMLGDDIESLTRALDYLKRAELGLYKTEKLITLELDLDQ